MLSVVSYSRTLFDERSMDLEAAREYDRVSGKVSVSAIDWGFLERVAKLKKETSIPELGRWRRESDENEEEINCSPAVAPHVNARRSGKLTTHRRA